jgi:PHP family Zn ribbon phosphoesterase
MKKSIPTEDFDRILMSIVRDMKVPQIMDLAGVYEAVSEEYNNEVIEKWEEEENLKRTCIYCDEVSDEDLVHVKLIGNCCPNCAAEIQKEREEEGEKIDK